ncbi:MAG: hypothetical protein EB023_05925 [Flavobacteriia bacterium]|nr:hypothetical protein [Flavobacteriia bacterium]
MNLVQGQPLKFYQKANIQIVVIFIDGQGAIPIVRVVIVNLNGQVFCNQKRYTHIKNPTGGQKIFKFLVHWELDKAGGC